MKRKQFTAGIAVIIAAVLFVAVNLLSNRVLSGLRVDLTEQGLYTLSQGTKNILQDLEEPITLRFYYSEDLATDVPAITNYARRVRELLQQYEQVSNGRVRVHEIDPEPFTAEEDRAVAYGLRGIPLGSEDENFYFGLVAADTTDQEAAITFFQPDRQAFLEYDVTQLIHQVAYPRRGTIGVLSTLPMNGAAAPMGGAGNRPWTVLEQIRQQFEVRMLEPGLSAVPDGVDVLMLVRPATLPDGAVDAVLDYVRGGGRALVFVDPYSEVDEQTTGQPENSPTARLLEAWGLDMAPEQVVANLSQSIRVQLPDGDLVNYPAWFRVTGAQQNADDVLTANLGELAFATPGALQRRPDAASRIAPLIQSPPDSMMLDAEQHDWLDSPQQLLGAYQAEGQYLLAARIAGLTDGDTAGRVVVVADTDLLRDQFWVQPRSMFGESAPIMTAANGRFVINALDNLTGSDDLISVRNRGGFTRPFTRIEALRRQAEQRFREKEQELTQQLEETRQKLLSLQTQGSGGEVLLGESERQAIERFRQQMLDIRDDLRDVQAALRQDIERLETRVKVVNIGLMALLVAVAGAVLGTIRAWRRRRKTV